MGPRPRDRRAGERGQATTETILLSWLIVMLLAAAYQVFLVNDQIARVLTIVHQQMFKQGFEKNTTDTHYEIDQVNVIWKQADIPEVMLPTLHVFQRSSVANRRLPNDFRIRTTPEREQYYSDAGMQDPDAKRTRMGAGTQMGRFEALGAGFSGIEDQFNRVMNFFKVIDSIKSWLGL